MRKIPPLSGGFLVIIALCRPACVKAQDARPFEDVRPDHWAYRAAANLHGRGIINGYPEGHFNGQRTLTRYEFAVALKRALDGLTGDSKSRRAESPRATPKSIAGATLPAPAVLSRSEADELQRLAVNFKDELTTLGVDTKEVLAKLVKLAAAAETTRRTDRIVPSIADIAAGVGTDRPRFGIGNSGAADPAPSLIGSVRPGDLQDGFGIRARIGSGTATLFGGALGGNLGNPGSGFSVPGLNSPGFASTLRTTLPPALAGRQVFGGSRASGYGDPALPARFDFGGPSRGRVFGLQGDLLLSKSGSIGLSYLDYSADRSLYIGPGSSLLGGSLGDVTLYGANVRLNPAGRFAFSGEASKSLSQRRFADDGGDDNNAYLLNLKYDGGPVTGAAGYQYYDPRFVAPGYANSLGGSYNPANLQGPYARVGGRLDRLQADLGVDYLTAARNRPGFGGFTQGSSVFRGQAGLGYHFSKQFELTANYEGVLYDMSGAISASGMRAKPVEQYITLGAGLNLSGNTVLKLAYQIINVQDAGNGFGLAPAFGGNSPGGGASTSVFTTQFAVHF